MNVNLRKKRAQQACTELTMSLYLRIFIAIGAFIAAIAAIVGAFAGNESLDRIASVAVLIFLAWELFVYGFQEAKHIRDKQRIYDQIVLMNEDNQVAAEPTTLELPDTYPPIRALSKVANHFRWVKEPRPHLANILVTIFVVALILICAAFVTTAGILVNKVWLQNLHQPVSHTEH